MLDILHKLQFEVEVIVLRRMHVEHGVLTF